MLRVSDVPAALGRVFSAPGLQDRTEQILCGQPVHRGSRLVAPVPVPGSVAGAVLFLNPLTAGSAGRNIQRSAVQSKETPDTTTSKKVFTFE